MNRRVLFAWIGNTDLRCSRGDLEGDGPIAGAAAEREFEAIHLLANSREGVAPYKRWLSSRCQAEITVHQVRLKRPTDFEAIYRNTVDVVSKVLSDGCTAADLTFHTSPGTPQMAAAWIILAKTRFEAELIESSLEHGVNTLSVPLEMSADFVPDLLRRSDEELQRISQGLSPEAPEFDEILHRSAPMKKVVALARRAAARNLPVLIEGETGTGKELFARAIHQSSPRRGRNFQAVNCGAIPVELVDSELFGHEKGAFTGASTTRKGHFEEADGGTIFLDEIGELPLQAQVRLLRVLQEGEVLRVGSTSAKKIDVRIIAATNRKLIDEVRQGRFREDLFYRLAVVRLLLPALRDRQGDLSHLIDSMLDRVNTEASSQPGFVPKKLSPAARNLLLRHPWPGNVRELINTLERVSVWNPGNRIEEADVRESLLPTGTGSGDDILGRPLGKPFNLEELLGDVARHYLERGLKEAGGNKTRASELVGFKNYQTFTNWTKKYGVD